MAAIRVENGQVVLATGTTFSISMGNGEAVRMLSLGDSLVAALFHRDDVDFRIHVDNSRSERGITFELTINKQSHWYSIDPGDKGEPMQALVANGNKLHFVSQATIDGKILVAATADKHAVGYENAAVMCSQIKISVKVEKLRQKITPMRITAQTSSVSASSSMHVAVTTSIEVEGHDYRDSTDCSSSASTQHIRGAPRQIGDRGAISYGEVSNQKFDSSKPANIDEGYIINPFVIELRMEPQYKAI